MKTILVYHWLIKDEDIDENIWRRTHEGAPYLYYRKESLFRKDMERIKKTKDGEIDVAITFDDGTIGQYEIAFPILEEYGYKGQFFIPTALIGKKGYMSWGQIKEIAEAGHYIYSHTHTHIPLEGLSEKEVLYELKTSADMIEKNIGKRPELISFPASQRNIDLVKKAGYSGFRETLANENLEVIIMTNKVL